MECRCQDDLGAKRWIGSPAESVAGLVFKKTTRTTTMAIIEIFQMTAQIQRWLDAQVARHLAALAAKLHH